jgi:hypothetical protein
MTQGSAWFSMLARSNSWSIRRNIRRSRNADPNSGFDNTSRNISPFDQTNDVGGQRGSTRTYFLTSLGTGLGDFTTFKPKSRDTIGGPRQCVVLHNWHTSSVRCVTHLEHLVSELPYTIVAVGTPRPSETTCLRCVENQTSIASISYQIKILVRRRN